MVEMSPNSNEVLDKDTELSVDPEIMGATIETLDTEHREKSDKILDEIRTTMEELSQEIPIMEEAARQMQELRKLPVAEVAEKIKAMDIEGFSNKVGTLCLKMSKIYVGLLLCRMQNSEDKEIIEQVAEIKKEVDLLESRLNIASNVREIIHQEAEEIVRKCDEILNPKKQ